jgi:hypothetical protein
MKCDDETKHDECGHLQTERIRYFTGRHMTARDFHDADAYHRSFRHLHNRVLHGWGIACGLDVHRHARLECGVIVRCGLALDCCGREIVVRRDVVQRPPLDDWPRRVGEVRRDWEYVLLLCLEYCETRTEKVPVLYNPQACSSPSYEDGRIREGYALCWRYVREDDLGKYGWRPPRGCEPQEPEGEQCEPPRGVEEEHRCCLDLDCPAHHCVPLAVLRLRKDCDDDEEWPSIDLDGRRSVGPTREQLTHICWISWPHGGIVKASDMHNLRVRFDRPLKPAERPRRPGPRGISERTFVVQYGEQREDLDFVTYRRPPHLSDDRRTAIYEVDNAHNYRDHIIQVTLRCDFIIDCHNRPVDGDHLRGMLPTGNGTAGGTFESWFRCVRDNDYEDAVREYLDEESIP